MTFEEICQPIPPYRVCLVHTKKEARKALRKMGMNDMTLDSDAATCYKQGERDFLVYISKKSLHRDAAQDIGLLAHEATHVAQGFFYAIGEKFPSDEFYAYTVQAATQELCDQHFAWKKRQLGDA